MRLLIVTQAVDQDDPVLGFFHRWIEEFAKHYKSIQVICLKEGRHNLPANVSVHSLGKERVSRISYLVSRIRYALRFWRYIWKLRKEYDAVFVHMNQEYILLGWKLWRLFGKRVILWRNHKIGSVWTRIAGFLAHTVCYTSPSAYVAGYRNAVRMPIGIDTEFFVQSSKPAPAQTILFLGRLDPVKKPEIFLSALKRLHDIGVEFHADIYGDPTNSNSPHIAKFKAQSAPLVAAGILTLHKGVSNDKTPDIYRGHSVYINLTPSGSFDKTIGEAMATGCVVVATNDAVRDVLPKELFVAELSAESVAVALRLARSLSESERNAITQRCRAYIERKHSLSLLAIRLEGILDAS